MNKENEDYKLFYACQIGSIDDFNKAIESGANPNASDSFTGSRPIHIAIRNGNVDIAEQLINNLHVELDVLDGGCWTPLLLAQHLEYFDLADMVSRGIERDHGNPNRPTLSNQAANMPRPA